ncbi:MAG: PepSY domain-containing protein, partial [Sphingomonas bacterium]|nr:PepSY domain-containing protein [Sphingomonas bacterium]
LVGPVMIAAPKAMTDGWAVAAESANRPLRTKLTMDGDSGAILTRRDFAQRQWIDRAVGYGVAIHEGAFFGLANQIAGTVVTALLVTLSVSGAVMWWRRRRRGTLGAPIPLSRPRYGIALVVAIGALGFAMPLFGATLLLVLFVERGTRGMWLAGPLGLMR